MRVGELRPPPHTLMTFLSGHVDDESGDAASLRVLILSADVAGGHDAAAQALRRSIEASHPHAQVTVENGLALTRRWVHRLIRDGYRAQLEHSRSSYRFSYWLSSIRPIQRFIKWFLYRVCGTPLRRAVRSQSPDIVVSTYPLLNPVLGGLRHRHRLRIPTAAIVTDIDPHDMWFSPGIDMHVVSVPADVDRVLRRSPRLRVRSAQPPLNTAFHTTHDRAAARSHFGIPHDRNVVLVSGGAWAVGDMSRIVNDLIDGSDAFVVALCAHNERLLASLPLRHPAERLLALPFVEDMPRLLACADTVVHTAAGLTALEALLTGTPLVVCHPIAGHGLRSVAALESDGLAAWPRAKRDLIDAVDRDHARAERAQRAEAGRHLFAGQPDLGTTITHVVARDAVTRRSPVTRVILRATRVTATLATSLLLGILSFAAMDEHVAAARSISHRAGRIECRTERGLARHVGWVERRKHLWVDQSC